MICRFFVYGTLKRGECRAIHWPRTPRDVSVAFVRAKLFDLGPYPALWCGDTDTDGDFDDDSDWVEGEVWTLDDADVEETCRVLDEVEETNQPGLLNQYDRIVVRAFTKPDGDTSELAFAYQFATRQGLDESMRIRPIGNSQFARWPDPTRA
jgi:gamma-glutamylcyclotransferase (GGCT)/AIG2-like uncharacterized protein YtfP